MTKANKTPSAERLHELFVYQHETGLLINRIDRKQVKAGEVAGWVNSDGYRKVKIDSQPFYQHRIVWKMAYDEDPSLEIDHDNTNKSDNRLCNLQLLTQRENCSKERAEGRGLPAGVSRHCGRYRANGQFNGILVYLGCYDTPGAASRAYEKAVELYSDGFSAEEIQKSLGVAQFSSKLKGVSWNKGRQKWVAQLTVNGKKKHLGYFLAEEAAHQAYLEATQ